MMTMKQIIFQLIVLASLCSAAGVRAQQEHGHDEHEATGAEAHEGEAGAEAALVLSPEEITKAGIELTMVRLAPMTGVATVPGEVRLNAYATADVTPRIPAQVVERHARLGDDVSAGDPLVTLSSVEVAAAQGEYLVAAADWQRVRELGTDIVSERRYTEARAAWQKAAATLRSYGLSQTDLDQVAAEELDAMGSGNFMLRAAIDGTVIFDEFVLGDYVDAGTRLFRISDESTLWVEASASPDQVAMLDRQGGAWATLPSGERLTAEVVQTHHMLSEQTRRQKVRLEIDNSADLVHPGQFVEVHLPTGGQEVRLSVPLAAVTLLEERPTVFRWDGEQFTPVPVETGRENAQRIEIVSGLEEGMEIAAQGVFHLKSLLLKSQLGSGHAH